MIDFIKAWAKKKKLNVVIKEEKRGFSWAITEFFNGDKTIEEIDSYVATSSYSRSSFDEGIERGLRMLYVMGHTDSLTCKFQLEIGEAERSSGRAPRVNKAH